MGTMLRSLSPRLALGFVFLISLALLFFIACQGEQGLVGQQGSKGDPGPQGVQGSQGLKGDKGDTGAQGAKGDKGDTGAQGAKGDKGDTGAQGSQGPQGERGLQGEPGPLPPGMARELALKLDVSKPSAGAFFQAGQAPVVTVTLNDKLGRAFTRDDFASLNLYMYGPQEPPKTKTAVKLLNAETDRAKTPHHYINLLTNPDAKVAGNVVTYNLKPVTDEAPGTYIVSLYAVQKADRAQQQFPLVELQIGTATVEKQIVDGTKCQVCHKGTSSGKFYFKHVDTSDRNPTGSWAIDSDPVRTCKSCHNTDGYAAYRGNINAPTTDDPSARTPDPIVRRVHGVHNGSNLENAFNADPDKGDFADYLHVRFPADVKNCTYCHLDDRNLKLPSRMACGACHDNTWFGEENATPAGMFTHSGGAATDDSKCSTCHTSSDTVGTTPEGKRTVPIPLSHKVDPPAFKHTIELVMSAPGNGKFYVAGEKPTVTITIKDIATGAVINPNTIVPPANAQAVQPNEWRRAYLFVSGPRSNTMPVLTTAATKVGPTASSYASNDFRVFTDPAKVDPKITRTATSIVYQLDDVKDLKAGTYSVWVETMPSAPLGGWALLNFQVGAATEDKKVATNCTQCHGETTQHSAFFAVSFNPDICKSCHDFKRQIEGKTAWTTSNNGYGAAPLSRRVHGVHFGHYLDKPKEVHATVDYSEVIFPQDVRNCTKCHDPATTTSAWKEKPSRVACLACHDTDAAITHAKLQTIDPTPAEAYSGDEMESCAVCHGANREFAADVVHKLADPYVPPYRREPPGD